jgi:hypothetical protein
MNILYLTTAHEDYLQDNLLYGLRMVRGADVVDYPRKDVLYRDYPKPSSEMYGRGFTAWKILDEIAIDRTEIDRKIRDRYFDTVVFGNVWQQTSAILSYLKARRLIGSGARFVFVDGEDRRAIRWPLVPLGPYYKRERMTWASAFTRKIGFAIPAMKVRDESVEKTDLFARHVQCDEAYGIDWIRQNCTRSYAFANEAAYYDNLARAKYAVTMKKAGWDCMRHYEIAANATVMAFFNLSAKPGACAPHGLKDMRNVVSFSTARELMEKIDHIEKHNLYGDLQRNSTCWALEHTCESMATQFLKDNTRS